MDKQARLEFFWRMYLSSFPEGQEPPSRSYEPWIFGDNQELADKLADLVCRGIKTATSSLLWEYETKREELPQVGQLAVVTDWDGEPRCVIEITEVEVRPFNGVDEQFVIDYGEGDRSLTWWHSAMWEYYTVECQRLGREPSRDMPLVCLRFRLLFPESVIPA